ncbi:MAG: T9SS type A sorting domain-containing protein, partial [Candidatus Fermentibacteria bacterium]
LSPGFTQNVSVSGNYAYIADASSGVRVVDISNPASPAEVGFCVTPDYANDVTVSGDYVYVADWSAGLRIIDISTPSSPFEAGFYDTDGSSRGIAVSGDYAFMADYDSGIRVYNVADPGSIVETGYYVSPGDAMEVAVSGNYAYVADWSYLGVYDCTEALQPVGIGSGSMSEISIILHQSYPNPFYSTTVISFGIESARYVEVGVYDLRGRLVSNLASQVFDPGNHSLRWNGTNTSGGVVPSGVYFARMQTADGIEEQKMLLIR